MIAKTANVNDLRRAELEKLRKELGLRKTSLLKPEDVVKLSNDEEKYPNLHSFFEWDDPTAAQEYRLNQARHLLVRVKILPNGVEEPFQAYVSLKSDRIKNGGGYRETVAVLSSKKLRAELLKQAMEEANYWKEKYSQLEELSVIFDAIEKIKEPANAKVKKGQVETSCNLGRPRRKRSERRGHTVTV